MTFKNQSLEIIDAGGLLSQVDFDTIRLLQDELQDTFQHVQIFRTRTEMEVSVLNDMKFPTADAKYWQAVREQNVMFTELVNLSFEARKLRIKIKMLERDMVTKLHIDNLEAELKQIDLEQLRFALLCQKRTAHDRAREIREWSEIKTRLIPDMQHSLTDVDEHQLVSYARRFVQEASAGALQGDPAGQRNLMACLDMSLKLAASRGCLEKVFDGLGDGPVVLKLKEMSRKSNLKIVG